jgi:hypothetical protein
MALYARRYYVVPQTQVHTGAQHIHRTGVILNTSVECAYGVPTCMSKVSSKYAVPIKNAVINSHIHDWRSRGRALIYYFEPSA